MSLMRDNDYVNIGAQATSSVDSQAKCYVRPA